MLRSVLTPSALITAAIGWAGAITLMLTAHTLVSLPIGAIWLVLALVVAVILIAAFGVVNQAEALAHRLGDPYGSLILTLSIVTIEVILIASVLLGPGEHTAIARDSVLSVMMIILGLVIGTAILVGARTAKRVQRRAVTSYITMIAALSLIAFAVPFVLPAGTYTGVTAFAVAIIAIVIYAIFIARQLGSRAADFRELSAETAAEQPNTDVRVILREHGKELLLRTIVLIVTVVPIVLMSHDMSYLMNRAFDAAGAPAALAGIVIAAIVFTPETLTTIRAAMAGEFQRVINLCLGAFVSTVGLTIPVVLVIGELTGQHIVLAPSAVMLGLVGAVIVTTVLAFAGGKTTRVRGILPVVVFAAFIVMTFVG